MRRTTVGDGAGSGGWYSRRYSNRGTTSPKRAAQLAVVAEGGRHQVVAFIDDQQVARGMWGHFDGLAEPDVVGDQQADARHAERLQQR